MGKTLDSVLSRSKSVGKNIGSKLLQTVVLSSALALIPSDSREEVIEVPVYQWGVDVQSAIDNANPGDTIRLVRGDYGLAFTGNWNVNKDLTFEAPEIAIRQNADTLMNINGNANVNVSFNFASADYHQTMIKVVDNASLNLNNSTLGNGTAAYLDWGSTGNLFADKNSFQGTEGTTQTSFLLNNLQGDITIQRNFMGWNVNPIVINCEQQQSFFKVVSLSGKTLMAAASTGANTLNIMNNTIGVSYGSAITINGNLDTTGYIINNNITDTPDALNTEASVGTGMIVAGNNFYENSVAPSGLFKLQTKSLLSSLTGGIYSNYSFDPLLVSPGYSDAVASNSQVYFNGVYVDGVTDYLQPNRTFIGSFNETMPETIPEPGTDVLVGLGLAGALAYAGSRKKFAGTQHSRDTSCSVR
jgi:hypothetical protein